MNRRDAKVFRADAAPHGVCDNLINALSRSENQQKSGDSSVMMVVQGVQEKSPLRTMDALRKFIMVDNHAAEKNGDSERNMESRKVEKAEVHDRFSGSRCP